MGVILSFVISFAFSFVGTIPPGTLNLSIIQLGLDKKIRTAWRFGIAASIVEYPYAWLAVKFEYLITSSPLITENIQLITAIVMLTVGVLTLWTANKPSELGEKFKDSGFRRGILLGILNPLALPFWVGTTAYLRGQHWIDLSTTLNLHAYLLGASLGALAVFMLFAYLAQRIISEFQQGDRVKKIPGYILLALGSYAFVRYLVLSFL
ncbi:MAG TPA: LysE family transporter [Chryseolinea sp.]|nr:LysE family transporter [Chryseolinea sp.]HPM31344.1 LysE family transporter [Chryseolinea sp.]